MKKLIVLAALAAVAAFGIVNVSAASAANCNFTATAYKTVIQGTPEPAAQITGSTCTGVDRWRVYYDNSGDWDDTVGPTYHPPFQFDIGHTLQNDIGCGSGCREQYNNSGTFTQASFWFAGPGMWYSYPTCRYLSVQFRFQIHNYSTGTWGSITDLHYPTYVQVCG